MYKRQIQGLVNDVKKYVSDAGIKAEIYGRAKHFFSIYKKMVNQDKTIDPVSYTHLDVYKRQASTRPQAISTTR